MRKSFLVLLALVPFALEFLEMYVLHAEILWIYFTPIAVGMIIALLMATSLGGNIEVRYKNLKIFLLWYFIFYVFSGAFILVSGLNSFSQVW